MRFFAKINDVFQSSDFKALLENFLSLTVLQVVVLILSLITLPYLVRVLGFENYGVIILALSLVGYFQSIVDYSFKITATRDVSLSRDNPLRLSLIYSRVMTIKLIAVALSYLVIITLVLFHPPFYEERTVFFLAMLMLLGYSLFPEWFFQGLEKMKYITIINVMIKLIFTGCIFFFIKLKEDYWIYPLLQSSGLIIAGIVGQIILFKKYDLKFIWLGKRQIISTLAENFPIFINQFSPVLYNNSSSVFLGLIAGSFWLGVYDAIKKIVELCVIVLNVFSRVFFPLINRKKDTFKVYRRLIFVLTSLMFISLLVFHDFIFMLLSITYQNSFYILLILAFSIFGYALYDIYGLNFFIIRRHDKLVMKNTIISSCIGFLSALPLIYYFGILGAALNVCFTRWIMGLGLTIKWFNYDNR